MLRCLWLVVVCGVLQACVSERISTTAPDIQPRGLYDSEAELVALFEYSCLGTAPDLAAASDRLRELGFRRVLGDSQFISSDGTQFAKAEVVEILPYGPRSLCSVGHRFKPTARLRAEFLEMLERHEMHFNRTMTTSRGKNGEARIEAREVWVGFRQGILLYRRAGGTEHDSAISIHFPND